MTSTHVTRHFDAPRSTVYRALTEADAIARWRFPAGMTCRVHELDAREGGRLRVSLTYEGDGAGKTSARTDTYSGRFARLVPDHQVVEIDAFETADPSLQGEMTITITLHDGERGGTELVAVHENLPAGVPLADNEVGWHSALDRLAALVEAG